MAQSAAQTAGYFDNTGRQDVLSGGVRMIPISTPQGEFRVWTKRVGNNPTIKVLLLHGGPGLTHEYFEGFDSFLPGAGVEYYYYDQLGSAYSDQPADMTPLLSIDRYVEEVEQVRKTLGLDKGNFYLLGNSWGGLLAIEYALRYQQHLKGLVVSNMMSSIPAYNRYAEDVLMKEMDPEALAEIKRMEAEQRTGDPRYMQLLQPHYERHTLRLPSAQWPEPVLRSFSHINPEVYVPMQGPSELGASGVILDWDRTGDLEKITVPTLVIGAKHDTMDPEFMRMMAGRLPDGRFLYCPNGSHLAMYDDQEIYMAGLIDFLHDVDRHDVDRHDTDATPQAAAAPR
ncbi:MAG: proline iminopeptidase-family hydrolase [Pseudomonadota bacterium]|nr:proline iminopeptidase-family hydrolase [Pseudomonadota bacterium]